MSLILTRSPYFVSRKDLDNDATIKLEIGDTIDGGDFDIEKTYNLAFRNSYLVDICPLIRDYLGSYYEWSFDTYRKRNIERVKYVRITVSGSKNGVAQSDVITESYVSDGYLYSTDEFNKDFSSELQSKSYYAGSTNIIYKLEDTSIRFPLVNTVNNLISGSYSLFENIDCTFFLNNEKVGYKRVTLDNEFSYGGYSYVTFEIESSQYSENPPISFLARVESDGGVLENNKCLDKFFCEFSISNFDKIQLSNANGDVFFIEVKNIEERKHKPYKVAFLNRFGVTEDLWFFKRSDASININKETFRGNSIGMYASGDGIKTMNHFNVNGKEKITLNSGFVDEEMNEAFRQLLLSEEVTLYDYKENKTYNVNLGTSELQYKQHINEKLINYTIEFEFAYEVINNVG